MKKLGTAGTPHDSTKKMVMIENERNGCNARQISIFLYFMANVTAKRILERLGIQTSSSFVKI